MTTIENTQECFVQLWLRLERTRQMLHRQCRRYCIRRVLKVWFGTEATDDFIWRVCRLAAVDDEPQGGWDELPPPAAHPLRHRKLLNAIVATRLGITLRQVDIHALDAAYSLAFPHSTPINIERKRRK